MAVLVCVSALTPLSLFTWAANKLGVEVPPTLEAAYEQRKAQTKEYKLQKRAGNVAQPTPVPPPEPAPAPEPAFEPEPVFEPTPVEVLDVAFASESEPAEVPAEPVAASAAE